MLAKDAIRYSLDSTSQILETYVNDLDDADLLVRSVPGMNHIAWQLGHLISAERGMVEGLRAGKSPALPEGFEKNHSKEQDKSDNPAQFKSKSEYLQLFKTQRAATKQVLEELSDAELDAPAPERMRNFCPTMGSVGLLIGNHVLMHVEQFVPVRRLKNKPIVI